LMKFIIKYNYDVFFLKSFFNQLISQENFLKIDFFTSSLYQYNSLSLAFAKHSYRVLYSNLKNLYNLIYYSFLTGCPVYLFSTRFHKNVVKSTNFFFSQFFKKNKTFVVVAVDSYWARQTYYMAQYLNYFIVKPVTSYSDYLFSSYPCFLDLTTEINSYVFIQTVKYIALKAIMHKNILSFKTYFFFLTFFKTYQII
jgi:hypothetical protein